MRHPRLARQHGPNPGEVSPKALKSGLNTSNTAPVRVLVLGRAQANSGVYKKMAGISRSLNDQGIVAEPHIGPERGKAAFRFWAKNLLHVDSDVVFLRADRTLAPFMPLLLAMRARGKTIVIDQPTPLVNGIAEISDRTPIPFIPVWLSQKIRSATYLASSIALFSSASRVITYSSDYPLVSALLGRKEARTQNGVYARSISVRDLEHRSNSEPVRLLAVGCYHDWHGLDRLLSGIADAKRRPDGPEVVLVAVGEGPERARLQARIEDEGLEKWVELRAGAFGDELHSLYSWADVGVGTLAQHRIGLKESSPIKHREYLAAGLPVLGTSGDALVKELTAKDQFYLAADDADTAIGIDEVLSWVRPLEMAQVSAAARAFAQSYLDYSHTHNPHVLGELASSC